MIHTVKGFGVVNKAEIDSFFWNSLAFSMIQQMLAIWSLVPLPFLSQLEHLEVHNSQLLKPGLENFEHYFANVWDEGNFVVVWAFFGIVFLGIRIKTDLFQSCGHCWAFQISWHIDSSTFTESSFRIEIAQLEFHHVALFIVMLPKPLWLPSPGYLATGEWSHHCDYLGHEDLFCTVLLYIIATSS